MPRSAVKDAQDSADASAQHQQAMPAPSADALAGSYFDAYSNAVERLFIERLIACADPYVAQYLVETLLPLRREAMADAINSTLGERERAARYAARAEQYESLYDSLDAMPDVQRGVIEMQAKLQDIAAIARKHATVHILRAEQGVYGASADDITYTLMHFRRQGVAAADVQRYLDELSAHFSLTSHPTNAMSVAHTVSAMALERVLSNPQATHAQLCDAVDAFIATPVAAARKKPLEELEELIPVLDNLFDAALLQRDAVQLALQVSGYADEGVSVRTPLLEVEDWSATFDGDGNANATRVAIEAGAKRKRDWVQGRYLALIDAMDASIEEESQYGFLKSSLEHVRKGLVEGRYASPQDALAALEELQQDYLAIDGMRHPPLDDLMYLMQAFGFHGSKGNLRHDAASINATLGKLLEAAGISTETPWSECSREMRSQLLSEWFADDDRRVLGVLRSLVEDGAEVLSPHSLEDDDTPQRIIERMQFLAQHPECCNKLIIAEATHPADAKAALALLYITGNAVACTGAVQEVVLLVESVADVRCLPETIQQLTRDPVYLAHLRAMGRITVMIAHSDNRRRDGYSAGEVITRTEGRIFRQQQELWERAVIEECQPLLDMSDAFGVPIHVFDGGGNDLMRGAAVNPGQTGKQHGHAAARENAPTIRTPQNTIQGEQTRLLFGYPGCAAMFLEMMVSQSMYARAAVEKRIGVVADQRGNTQQKRVAQALLSPRYQQDQVAAQRASVLFHDAARKAFHRYTDAPSGQVATPFDALYSHSGAWISTLLANRGSRSNQRGKQDGDTEKTVAQIRGMRTALSQRAITGNLLFQLTGTFHLGLLGQLEAFETIGEEAAHRMFHSSLPDRTHIVGAAQQLHMTDFRKAWRMMGQEMPPAQEVESLAASFREQHASSATACITPRQTLAFMQDYGLRLAAAIVYAATGKRVSALFADAARPFTMQDAYRTLLPELSRQLDLRHASHEAEHLAIARLEHLFSQFPDQKITEHMEMMSVALAASLAYDVRPSLGPMAVRGAKGVATTHEEHAVHRDERAQPDIRAMLEASSPGLPFAAGIRSVFTNNEALDKLTLPLGLL